MTSSPTADTWAQPQYLSHFVLPPKLPRLQLLEIEIDDSKRFSINLMGMKPSFWSQYAAHVAKVGLVTCRP